MKVALCFSGQPRNAVEISKRIKETIINDNDVDVFMHTWYDSNDLNYHKRCPGYWDRQLEADIDKKILDIYEPKSYIFESPKKWSNSNMKLTKENIQKCFDYGLNDPNGIECFSDYMINCTYSHFYSNLKSHLLREDYSINTGTQYDCVIKLRYDVSPTSKLDLVNGEFDENVLYYQDLNQPLGMVSDWFALGSSKVMNIWSSMYLYIEPLYYQVMKEEGMWCNELLLRNHLKNNKIETEAVDLGVQF